MWQFLSEHYNLALGLLAAVIWAGAVLWFLHLAGFLTDWLKLWRGAAGPGGVVRAPVDRMMSGL